MDRKQSTTSRGRAQRKRKTRRCGVKHRARLEAKRLKRELLELEAALVGSSHPGDLQYDHSTIVDVPLSLDTEVIDCRFDTEEARPIASPPSSPLSVIDTDQALKANYASKIPNDILQLYIKESANIRNNYMPASMYQWCEQMYNASQGNE